ncbi:MAG: protein-glutamate O-methyltransferase CheR [Candidatus Manganitrophaceae bacterium]|nr:MAG: protein-glutamate O-methyltransferase CheR [Candidatus Manganitrophaceae bacterium]
MNTYEQKISLTDEVFRLLRDMIYEISGIYFSDDSKFIMESRLQQSVKRKQFDNFRDYYYFLKYDQKRDEELASLIDIITIHETYFFRESQQLQTFSQEVLPELAQMESKTKLLRLWSAGCSTGEEPYTLSMLLLENPLFHDWTIEIYASDISQNVLQTARRGIYQAGSFRTTDPYYQKKYFTKEASGFKIDDRVKKNVTFLHLNLNDQEKWILLPNMNSIFCRNVIIYFDLPAKKRVIEGFYGKLKQGGYLLLGHSESLMSLSTHYTLKHFKNDLVYQKPFIAQQ